MKADYIFLRDMDMAACVTLQKERTQEIYTELDGNRLIIVRTEIESWYLAGLDESKQNKLKIPIYNHTDNVTKEQLDSLKPKPFVSRIDFMIEILKHYSVDTAQNQNTSFNYFFSKHLLR
jgi:hypothetical protein